MGPVVWSPEFSSFATKKLCEFRKCISQCLGFLNVSVVVKISTDREKCIIRGFTLTG